MRFLPIFALSLSLFACADRPAAAPARPPPSSTSTSSRVERVAPATPSPAAETGPVAERTVIDDDSLAIALPGRWEQLRTDDGGYDLRRGREEIVVAAFPLKDGLNDAKSAEWLSSSQRQAMIERFHCTELREGRHVASVHIGAVTSTVTCESPQLVISFAAGSTGRGRVVSYEHYWYGVTAITPEMDRADTANLETLLLKPVPETCPPAILAGAEKGVECLDPTILGEAVVADCARELESRHCARNDALSGAMGRYVDRPLVCYRRASR